MNYKVKVFKLGQLIYCLVYRANSALDACNLAESFCKQRPLYWYARTDDNKKQLYVKGYRGYSFEAQKVGV